MVEKKIKDFGWVSELQKCKYWPFLAACLLQDTRRYLVTTQCWYSTCDIKTTLRTLRKNLSHYLFLHKADWYKIWTITRLNITTLVLAWHTKSQMIIPANVACKRLTITNFHKSFSKKINSFDDELIPWLIFKTAGPGESNRPRNRLSYRSFFSSVCENWKMNYWRVSYWLADEYLHLTRAVDIHFFLNDLQIWTADIQRFSSCNEQEFLREPYLTNCNG